MTSQSETPKSPKTNRKKKKRTKNFDTDEANKKNDTLSEEVEHKNETSVLFH